MMRNVMAIVKN